MYRCVQTSPTVVLFHQMALTGTAASIRKRVTESCGYKELLIQNVPALPLEDTVASSCMFNVFLYISKIFSCAKFLPVSLL